MTWMAYEAPTTRRRGGRTNVPSDSDSPASTIVPSVHTSAMPTARVGMATPRTLRNESQKTSSISPSASGVKR
jgi:hypothetical protein